MHVVSALSRGGAGRALLAAAALRGSVSPDRVASLGPADPFMVRAAAQLGIDVAEEPSASDLAEAVADTDIVQLHFWNDPEVYRFLAMDLPPRRTIVWCHVLGASAPQVFCPELLDQADQVVAVNPRSVALLSALAAEADGDSPPIGLIPPVPGWSRLQGLEPRPHESFTVGYLGSVDPVKMHPDFVGLCRRVGRDDVRFVVCGSGRGWETLSRAAASGVLRDRMDVRGYVEDIARLLPEFDVFGYPLAPDNYSASDLVLMEVMYAGVPPVVLPHGGAADMVEHLRTGIVADDEDDYVRWIEVLHDRPELRARLGAAASDSARRRWDPAHAARQWTQLYDALAARPRRARAPLVPPPGPGGPGAQMFVLSLGTHARDFRLSLDDSDLRATLEAEQRIANAGPGLASPDAGGVLHWRIAHPDDANLRYWSGLVFRRQGRHALAIAELTAARRLGCDHWRMAWHLRGSAEAAGMLDALAGPPEIPADVPTWARPLLELEPLT